MFSGDFVRLVASNTFKHADGIHADNWTDAELLLLLEGVEMYDDDFDAVAMHVGTRTKEQCVAQFLQLPIEDEYREQEGLGANHASQGALGALQYARIPFEKNDNPVMSVVAFLAGAVGPGVAAAATQAGLSELAESLKRKAEQKRSAATLEDTSVGSTGDVVTKAEDGEAIAVDGPAEGTTSPKSISGSHPGSSVERAAAIALASASVKARALASTEDDKIRALTDKIVTAQLQKVQLKLDHFSALEELVEEEKRRTEEAKQLLFLQRGNIATLVDMMKGMVQDTYAKTGQQLPQGYFVALDRLTQAGVEGTSGVGAHPVVLEPGEYESSANLAVIS
jgi:SWI/SNF related-matrix-associated actin-dependent regulator of chromatin subfamily C